MFWTHKFVSARTHKPNIENESLLSMSATYILNAIVTLFIIKGNTMTTDPEVTKKFHAQLSMKFQLLTKIKIPTIKEVPCFKYLRCCIYHANKCSNANNCWHLNIL